MIRCFQKMGIGQLLKHIAFAQRQQRKKSLCKSLQEFFPISWTKHITTAKYPENTPKTRTKSPATIKYPENTPKTWRESPDATKYPHFSHKTGRKCVISQKKVTGMSPLLPLADLGIVRWGLAVFFQRIQLGAQKGICRMLHQGI